jgi:thiol-disulfide isomerase/thioredoxin
VTDPSFSTTSQPTRRRHWRLRLAAAALFAVITLGLGAVYAVGGFGGNAADPGKCAVDRDLAHRLKARAVGEVAAFVPAETPRSLAGLGFDEAAGPTTLAARAGRVVLLNLWATWCGPCRKEMPALDRLQQKLGSKDFEVIAVNIDQRNPERARRFREEIGVAALAPYADPDLTTFHDLQRVGLARGLPTTVLIGRDGCELGALAGPAEWDGDAARALIGEAIDHRRSGGPDR